MINSRSLKYFSNLSLMKLHMQYFKFVSVFFSLLVIYQLQRQIWQIHYQLLQPSISEVKQKECKTQYHLAFSSSPALFHVGIGEK